MSAIAIRKYRQDDQHQVAALWETVLPDSQPHNRPDVVLAKKLAVDDLIFVAEEEALSTSTVGAGTQGLIPRLKIGVCFSWFQS